MWCGGDGILDEKNTEKRLQAGEWVGYADEIDQRNFIRISFSEEWCDLPQDKLFNLETVWDEEANIFRAGDVLTFSLKGDENRLEGHLEDGRLIKLWREIGTVGNPNWTIGGYYRLTDGKGLHIFAQTKADTSAWQVYSRQGRRLIRLFPVGERRYLSEDGDFYDFKVERIEIIQSTGGELSGRRIPLFQHESLDIPTRQGHTLSGVLLKPVTTGPHPLVILVHGAGPGYGDDYLGFVGYFLERGIAAFIYDKRGWGESGGEEVWSDVFKLADDAEEVIRFLKSHPAVKPRSIGLIGFSNGGWVAPLAASRFTDVAFVISFSGSGVSPARQETIRRCTLARNVLGASMEQIAILEIFWEHAFKFLATGKWTAAFESILHTVENDPNLQALPKHAGMPDGLQPIPPLRSREEWNELGGESPDMLFDPLPVFTGLHSPLLFVWGKKDSLVPVAESVKVVADLVQSREEFTTLVFPEAGHQLFLFDPDITFARPIGDEIARFGRVPRFYAPGVWEGIINWTLEHL